MATYRKLLKNRAGDTIIPVVEIINYLYPVGSIFMSATMSTATQVQNALGGTWTAWGAGRVPVGVNTSDSNFNTVEKTGGEKTHALTVAETPSHSHRLSHPADICAGGANIGAEFVVDWNSGTQDSRRTESVGGGGAHNNLQPYITCYMYKRTA